MSHRGSRAIARHGPLRQEWIPDTCVLAELPDDRNAKDRKEESKDEVKNGLG